MSNTVTPTMTLSSSYVPRNPDGSRPASPALSSSYRPRPRRLVEGSGDASPAPVTGSRLKNEVKEAEIQNEILALDEATLQNARDILEVSPSPVDLSVTYNNDELTRLSAAVCSTPPSPRSSAQEDAQKGSTHRGDRRYIHRLCPRVLRLGPPAKAEPRARRQLCAGRSRPQPRFWSSSSEATEAITFRTGQG